mgnify:CR=1 FL=1
MLKELSKQSRSYLGEVDEMGHVTRNVGVWLDTLGLVPTFDKYRKFFYSAEKYEETHQVAFDGVVEALAKWLPSGAKAVMKPFEALARKAQKASEKAASTSQWVDPDKLSLQISIGKAVENLNWALSQVRPTRLETRFFTMLLQYFKEFKSVGEWKDAELTLFFATAGKVMIDAMKEHTLASPPPVRM